MKIHLRDGLLYVTAELTYQEHCQTFANVLLDTGSGSTIFATDQLLLMGLRYEPEDSVHRIHGVGGTEFVFTKRVMKPELPKSKERRGLFLPRWAIPLVWAAIVLVIQILLPWVISQLGPRFGWSQLAPAWLGSLRSS